MAEVDALRRAAEDLRQKGDAALSPALPVFEEVGRMMATKLALHAKKEDDVLFPAMERAMGTSQGPTSVMREEHSEIHDRVRLLGETLRELHEIEHPAIVAEGTRLHRLAHAGGTSAALAESAETLVQLLDRHFSKEENVLFPMAKDALTDAEMAAVAERMAAFCVDADLG